MATITVDLHLGTSQTGLALKAQVVDVAGAAVGVAITTGFVERGAGVYLWTGAIPDGHRGGIDFLTTGSVYKTSVAIEPEADPPGIAAILARLVPVPAASSGLGNTARTVLRTPVPEKSTFRYDATLFDETGTAIPAASLTKLQLTLYDEATGQVLVDHVSILNVDRGTVDTAGNLAVLFTPADSPIVTAASEVNLSPRERVPGEWHIALLEYEWASGARAGKHELRFPVVNLAKVP